MGASAVAGNKQSLKNFSLTTWIVARRSIQRVDRDVIIRLVHGLRRARTKIAISFSHNWSKSVSLPLVSSWLCYLLKHGELNFPKQRKQPRLEATTNLTMFDFKAATKTVFIPNSWLHFGSTGISYMEWKQICHHQSNKLFIEANLMEREQHDDWVHNRHGANRKWLSSVRSASVSFVLCLHRDCISSTFPFARPHCTAISPHPSWAFPPTKITFCISTPEALCSPKIFL